MDQQTELTALGQETLDHIAQALWLDSFDVEKIPPEILERLTADKNSSQAFGERMRARVRDLLAHPESFTPSQKDRYETLLKHIDTLTPHQTYALGALLGPDSNRGFETVPDKVKLEFPRDHRADLQATVGWYFIVGSCIARDGVEYGVLMMLMNVSVLPPALAQSFGLSELENQLVDFQFAINRGSAAHYQAVPLCVAGTSGLVEYSMNPFVTRMGKNEIRSLQNEDLFPMQVRARGWDRGASQPVEMEIDFSFSSAKGVLLQGKDGIAGGGGVGFWYYSMPDLVLDPNKSTLRLDGETVALREGQFWLDHQWGVLGSPRSEVLRAAMNLAPPSPGGWDWFEMHLVGNRQITMGGMHTHENLKYYSQEGADPPGVMTARVTGKYMDENAQTLDAAGTLRVTDWVQNPATPDPAHYWGTNTWQPNRWEFQFDAPVPHDLRNLLLVPLKPSGSPLYFTSGGAYQEAPVHVLDRAGNIIGRGYAEAVNYANTQKNILAIAGLPVTEELLAVVESPLPTLMTKIASVVEVLTHQDELKQALL